MHWARVAPAAAAFLLACQSSPEEARRDWGCLSLRSEEGRSRMRTAQPEVRAAARAHGRPEYVCDAGGEVHFVYAQRDEALTLQGDDPPREASPVPGELLELLPKKVRVGIEAGRALSEPTARPAQAPRPRAEPRTAKAQKAPARPAKARTAPARPARPAKAQTTQARPTRKAKARTAPARPAKAPVPAAPAPAPSQAADPAAAVFDVEILVAELAEATDFGAPGLEVWELDTLPDGSLRAMAREREQLFELRPDRASVVVPLDASRPKTLSAAALACRRLSDAIFQHPQSAKKLTLELLRAAAREEGERRYERKLAGRTLSAERVGEDGEVLFAIHAR